MIKIRSQCTSTADDRHSSLPIIRALLTSGQQILVNSVHTLNDIYFK